MVTVTPVRDWVTQGESLFGEDRNLWEFVCPSCGNVQTGAQMANLGQKPEKVYLSCIGRYDGEHGDVQICTRPGPCNYTSGGLINLNPVIVQLENGKTIAVFAFNEGNGNG